MKTDPWRCNHYVCCGSTVSAKKYFDSISFERNDFHFWRDLFLL